MCVCVLTGMDLQVTAGAGEQRACLSAGGKRLSVRHASTETHLRHEGTSLLTTPRHGNARAIGDRVTVLIELHTHTPPEDKFSPGITYLIYIQYIYMIKQHIT